MTIPLFNVILIETINVCTRRCWFCKFGQGRPDKTVFEMEWEIIERIVRNLRDLRYGGRISWFWINEPLLEKRIFDVLKLTKEQCPHAFLSLVTNGDLLNPTTYHTLKTSGLDALGVSIYDEETLARVRPLQDSRLVLLDRRRPAPGSLENRAGNIKQQADVFENNKRMYEDRSCGRPFSMMTINPKGKAVLCCSDIHSNVVMGDVKDQRLENIWDNRIFNHYRQTLYQQGRKNLQLCKDCSYYGAGSPVFFPFRDKPSPKPATG